MQDTPNNRDPKEMSSSDRFDVEREQLVEERRTRQTGKRGNKVDRKTVLVGTIFAAGAIAVVVAVGPTKALKIFGLADNDTKTSQVDMEVDRTAQNNQKLDFLVPEPPAPVEPKVDPNAELNKRFEELRKQIDNVAHSNKTPDVSLADVQKLLQRYNEDMAQKLNDERQKVEAENARLRSEAEKAEEERKRLEDAAKLDAEKQKEVQAINTKQTESNGVIIDESGSQSGSADNAAQPDVDRSSNDRFLSSAAGSEVKTSVSRRLPDPSRTVAQGTIIPAVLETAINTELPGNIRAHVTEPVFSFDGSRILFPAGTTLVGTFNDKVDLEQKRVLIAWNRALTPDGKSVALGSTGTDLLGRSGTEGNVDNRYGKKIGAAVLLSTITSLPSIIPSLVGNNRSSRNGGTTINVGSSGSGGSDAGGQAASNITGAVSNQGKGILDKYLSLPPIVRIPQGEEIRVFVNRDLVIR